MNHGRDRYCQRCHEEANALAWAKAHIAARHERRMKSAVSAAWSLLPWLLLAIAAAAGLAWVLNAASFWLGGRV